jgi:hypothetical protein
MGDELVRPMGETMKTKLIVIMGAVGLAAWMGASFVAPAEVAPRPLLGESAESSDSHRLGIMAPEEVDLPGTLAVQDGPNLFCLLTKEN